MFLCLILQINILGKICELFLEVSICNNLALFTNSIESPDVVEHINCFLTSSNENEPERRLTHEDNKEKEADDLEYVHYEIVGEPIFKVDEVDTYPYECWRVEYIDCC